MSQKKYSIGLDYGTNSVRGVLVDTSNGKEVACHVYNYAHGIRGIITDSADHNLARQHPRDYIDGMELVIESLLRQAKKLKISSDAVVGIGIDTTGSTPIPVDKNNVPIAFAKQFAKNKNALAWLWKDHTSFAEAQQITDLAKKIAPQYIAKCGKTYSSEWFFSKILHCLRIDRPVFDAAYSWVELCDFVPAWLCGVTDPSAVKRGICAAGHKALYHDSWGGLPARSFLNKLDPALGDLRSRLFVKAEASDQLAGFVSAAYKKKFGFANDVAVAIGAFDCHFGAVGAGVKPGVLVKIIGTSTCDITVAAGDKKVADIPGVCGVVPGSVVPGMTGIEAGQSAVGDIFNWYVSHVCCGDDALHGKLTTAAKKLRPGQSGLLALDWNNGNRTILVDVNLTGMLLGQTLHTTQAEIYRALIEATAFGARRIIERIEEFKVPVDTVINCGGISHKNPMLMQIYADIIKKPMIVSSSEQTCAFGSAIFGAVVGKAYSSIGAAQKVMVPKNTKRYIPSAKASAIYDKLYTLYCQLHDSFGTASGTPSVGLYPVMKQLLEIKRSAATGEKE